MGIHEFLGIKKRLIDKSFPEIEGVKLYLLGGSVRDFLLGRETNDRDFIVITELGYDELADRINDTPGHRVLFKKEKTRTIRMMFKHEPIDLIFPKGKYGYGKAKPKGISIDDILMEDARVKDFTVNSMFLDGDSDLKDYFGGVKDIKERLIRAVEDPHARFKEEPLRILRAIRFAVTLGFDIERKTFKEMKKMKSRLMDSTAEMIREEINKALKINPVEIIDYIGELGLLDILEEKGLNFELSAKKRGKGKKK